MIHSKLLGWLTLAADSFVIITTLLFFIIKPGGDTPENGWGWVFIILVAPVALVSLPMNLSYVVKSFLNYRKLNRQEIILTVLFCIYLIPVGIFFGRIYFNR